MVENQRTSETESKTNQAITNKVIKDIGTWITHSFEVDTAQIYKKAENEEEERKIRKIRKINMIEFYLTLFGVFGLMWGMWWPGIISDNDTIVTTSFVLIGLIGIWGIIISPFYHYKLEKGITYRKGYLGLDYEQNAWTAFFEERGFGSIKKHLESLKDDKYRKTATFVSLYVMITLVIVCFDDMDYLKDIAEFVGLSQEPFLSYIIYLSASIVYMVVALLLFGFGTYQAGAWKDTGDKDNIKRFLLVVPQGIIAFMGIWLLWGWGMNINNAGHWYPSNNLTDLATMYQTIGENFANPQNPMGLAMLAIFVAFVVVWFLVKYVVVGIMIRFNNLKTAMFQFVFISIIATVAILIVWGVFTLDAIQPYVQSHSRDLMDQVPYGERLWYIFRDDAFIMMRKATFARIIGNWAGYIYWGLAQELLFLGYWCTLLTKVYKNKYVIALLSSLCFGLIHFPSWPLMIFTCVGGFFWAIAWQRNDSRNIFVMGAIHGYAGTLVAKFIPITMSVGPSNMA